MAEGQDASERANSSISRTCWPRGFECPGSDRASHPVSRVARARSRGAARGSGRGGQELVQTCDDAYTASRPPAIPRAAVLLVAFPICASSICTAAVPGRVHFRSSTHRSASLRPFHQPDSARARSAHRGRSKIRRRNGRAQPSASLENGAPQVRRAM